MSLVRWTELVANVNGRTLFGQAAVRDPDYPCEAFWPGPLHSGDGDCSTDGHYMCDECRERKTCEGCGRRPSQCECACCMTCWQLQHECACAEVLG